MGVAAGGLVAADHAFHRVLDDLHHFAREPFVRPADHPRHHRVAVGRAMQEGQVDLEGGVRRRIGGAGDGVDEGEARGMADDATEERIAWNGFSGGDLHSAFTNLR